MSLSDLASLGSFVSGIAVLVSLVYLALQVRQTQKNQRALIHQGRTAQTIDRIFRVAEPQFLRPWLKVALGREPLPDEVELQQFSLLSAVTLREMQDVYFQSDLGLLDNAAVNNHLAALRPSLSPLAGKAFWNLARNIYDPKFVARVDAFEKTLPVQSGSEGIERLRKEIAKVKTANGPSV